MKQLLFIIAFIGIAITSNAQIGVSAVTVIGNPTQEAHNTLVKGQMAKDFAEATKQTAELKKQWDMLKKAAEKVEKFNSKLKKYEKIASLADISARAIKRCKKAADVISNLDLNPKYVLGESRRCLNNVRGIVNCGKDAAEILKDNNFNLGDGERIRLIDEKIKEMRRLTAESIEAQRRAERIAARKELFNRR